MNKILGLLAAGVLAGPMAANAVPITVSAGDTLLWNFDLSGQTPAPPYPQGAFVPFTSMFDVDDSGEWAFFSDLDGGGIQFDTEGVDLAAIWSDSPGWTDGIWSIRLTMTAGSISVDPSSLGLNSEDLPLTEFIPGTLVTTPVPEPSPLALLGLGLLGLGVQRRRRAN